MRKLLLVDDDEDFRLIIRDLIEDCDACGPVAISEAASSAEAERLSELHDFDVYVVDYLMDVDSGGSSIGFLAKLFARYENPAVILCTGFSFEGLAPAYQELLLTGTMRLLPKESLSRATISRILQQLMGNSMSVLLAEDDQEDADYVCAALEGIPGFHFDVEIVHTIEEGLEALRSRDFDLHLIDYRLGACDSTELVRRVIARTARPPIVISQYPADSLDMELVEKVGLGEVLFVPKLAIDTSRLVNAVQRVTYQSLGVESRDE